MSFDDALRETFGSSWPNTLITSHQALEAEPDYNKRADSPIESNQDVLVQVSRYEGQPVSISRKPMDKPQEDLKVAGTAGVSWLFVAQDPEDPGVNRGRLPQIRRHVMGNYLDNERRNPTSKDPRVHRSEHRPGRRTGGRPRNSLKHTESRGQRVSTASGSTSTLSQDSEDKESSDSRVVSKRRHRSVPDRSGEPLIKGLGQRHPHSRYIETELDEVPFEPRRLGGALNPFNTWPVFDTPWLNVTDLKWQCSRRFGSYGIAVHWVPTLLQARHAFLSTICISTAHDDIMSRAAKPAEERSNSPSFERVRVRQEVIEMINESLRDPHMQTADVTIVAVFHLLESEIMGCNDSVMRIHQLGLHEMVKQRGGLHKLGLHGRLASVLTITMYIIGVLRETSPHPDFINYAACCNTIIHEESPDLPESPVCTRPTGYSTIYRAVKPNSPTAKLLATVRVLSNKFIYENGQQTMTSSTPFRHACFWDQSEDSILTLRDEIFALPSAIAMEEFRNPNDRYTYEAIRLTSLIYSHALAMRLPFSQAAAQLHAASDMSNANSSRPAGSLQGKDALPLPQRIRNMLLKTDVSACWGHLAGVLFWVTLVAGASASPGPLTNEDRGGEDEHARKWLAAISVRCSIILSLDFGSAILETVKRLVTIESLLASGNDEGGLVSGAIAENRGGVDTVPWNATIPSISKPVGGRNGAELRAMPTFSDYRLDFEDA